MTLEWQEYLCDNVIMFVFDTDILTRQEHPVSYKCYKCLE